LGRKGKRESGVVKICAVERAPGRETGLKKRRDRELGVGGSVLHKKETQSERCCGRGIVGTARERG
jgi:hypothetical protein